MTNIVLFTAVTYVFFGAFLLYLFSLAFRNERAAKAAALGLALGWIMETIGLVMRTYEFSRQMMEKMPEKAGSFVTSLYYYFPVTNLYESLVFFSWTTVVIYLWIDYRYKARGMGAPVALLACASMAYAALSKSSGSEIEPLVPALQSNWVTIHVITCFLAYAFFAVSFGASIYYIFVARRGDQTDQQKERDVLDGIIYKTVVIGFILLAIGIVTGAAWADYAWGSYWSWDAKETWSLITWLVYAAFLHSRFALGWHGRRSAIFSIIGFGVTLFCYLGVNLVLSGLHSYGSPE